MNGIQSQRFQVCDYLSGHRTEVPAYIFKPIAKEKNQIWLK